MSRRSVGFRRERQSDGGGLAEEGAKGDRSASKREAERAIAICPAGIRSGHRCANVLDDLPRILESDRGSRGVVRRGLRALKQEQTPERVITGAYVAREERPE